MLRQFAATLAIAVLVAPLGCGSGAPTPRTADPASGPSIAAKDPVVIEASPSTAKRGTPKVLGDTVKRGLAWLVTRQLQSGGWGQGDDAPQQRNGEPGAANVADSAMALLAFIRAGSTPRAGEHRLTVERGLDYVMSQIEASDQDSLFVTSIRGTRVQAKIGQYADTFAAMMVLTEVRNQGRDAIANARIDAALKKVVRKVEKNQRENGTWDDNGWAPVLSQALAAKGLNRAAQGGMSVSAPVLQRAEAQAASPAAESTGTAGVGLYGKAAKSSNQRDSAATKKVRADELRKKANKPAPGMQSPSAPTPAEIAAADAAAATANQTALETERELIKQLGNPQFVAGFGNNGGEEFLSYLLISETLVQQGGDEWARWDGAISSLVDKVQNEDGSWTGHHCITGRTFCTAAALLVLMGDRTPASRNVIAS